MAVAFILVTPSPPNMLRLRQSFLVYPTVKRRNRLANIVGPRWAMTMAKPRRVVAKVEWHPGELCPRVGFIVTNMARPPENVVALYNKQGTCQRRIKEGKGAVGRTRFLCRAFAVNVVCLQLYALAYNLGNFLRALATPEPMKDWPPTSLKEKLITISAKVVSHRRYVAFRMAEAAISGNFFADILRMIAKPQPPQVASSA
jgi:hypothetical protein